LIELLKQLLLQIPAVSHLRSRIQKGELRKLLGSLSHGPLPRVVIEDLDRTDDFTLSAPNRTDADLHGNPVATSMVKVNVCPMRTPIHDGTAERAFFLTEQAPGVIDVHQNVVGTACPYNIFSPVSGKVFRRLVPVRNPTVPISKVDTVKKAVQHLFEQTGRFI
jgi:hypothetical protein